jgi:uncharacterized protein (UPF0333 family)
MRMINKKGQVAIEFIFILLIIVVYIFTVTKPLIESGSGAINDIERISKIRNQTDLLAETINSTYLLGDGTVKSVIIFVPRDSNIICSDTIGFSAKINEDEVNPEIGSCENNICDYNASIYTGINLNCSVNLIRTGQYRIITEKNGQTINVGLG